MSTSTYSNLTQYYQDPVDSESVGYLMPINITTSQTLYQVSLLVSPGTYGNINYTLRPAVYTQTSPTNFTLLAQAAQTLVTGSTLAYHVTELHFPLLTPITVTAGSTIWLMRQVD